MDEFTGWFLSLCKVPDGAASPSSRVSQMELIQLRAMLRVSTVQSLSQQHRGKHPAQVVIGASAIGTLLMSYGCPATPSADHKVPLAGRTGTRRPRDSGGPSKTGLGRCRPETATASAAARPT
jgi:hypothetical protein